MNWNTKQTVWLAGTILVCVLGTACEKKVAVPKGAAGAFASAKPEMQQAWNSAATASVHSDYLGAITNLMVLRSQAANLSPEQSTAVEELWGAIGTKAFEAAEKGDAKAVEAVKMSQAGRR